MNIAILQELVAKWEKETDAMASKPVSEGSAHKAVAKEVGRRECEQDLKALINVFTCRY